ncbi:MAG: biotin synthase BioB [Oligoflexales bacterium]
MAQPRHDTDYETASHMMALPFPRLMRLAQQVHQNHHRDDEVQMATLLSIKTGGCKENCHYCPQSAHHQSEVDAHGLLSVETVLASARKAKQAGATRFCMGAAWRNPPEKGPQFGRVLEIVREVKQLGMEVCTTLGMLSETQAQALQEAGVYAYNHNLDTSPEYYDQIVSTRTYQDRLDTLSHVRDSGMQVCCGGIVGMGETREDRLKLLLQLHHMDPHPESVPINLLVRVEGTPLSDQDDFDIFEMIRTIAMARILMPKSRVRLSAGRTQMSDEAQALAFLAGANSIFGGDRLLTTPNPGDSEDERLLSRLGMRMSKLENSAYEH